MNLLEHYIKEIHSVEICEEEWTKDEIFEGEEFLKVDVTYDCYGVIERRVHYWNKEQFEKIKKDGYFMA